MGTRYEEGDVVATPDGRGVIAAVLTETFDFPREGDEDAYERVTATDDQPAYVVGLESVGSAPYRASALEASSLDGEGESTEGERLAGVIDEAVNGLDSLPEGWDRESVLEYWEGIGGSWDDCVDDMEGEFGKDRAKQHCSAMKDEVLRTERWRNRF